MKEIIGYTACAICIFSVTPQLIQVIKTNSTDDLSLFSIILLLVNSIFWIWYGVLIDEIPIILTDALLISQQIIIFTYKIKHMYYHNNDRVEE